MASMSITVNMAMMSVITGTVRLTPSLSLTSTVYAKSARAGVGIFDKQGCAAHTATALQQQTPAEL